MATRKTAAQAYDEYKRLRAQENKMSKNRRNNAARTALAKAKQPGASARTQSAAARIRRKKK